MAEPIDIWLFLELLPFSQEVGATAWFPFVESIHVLSIVLMLGAILMVDLRILGLSAMPYSAAQLLREFVPWSAVGFVIASVTGVIMFMTRAATHIENPAFQIKLLLLLLGGINIVCFHFREKALLAHDSVAVDIPISAKIHAALSLSIWIGVMVAGRWVGHVV
ncbi:MAG: DUF6644 family protein [Pseudohongiellaceae bacterium]|nr:DUF6644 family protein [Pseudohongiellaceae bacterium]